MDQLLIDKDNIINIIDYLKKELNIKQQELKIINNKIYNTCEHEWITERESGIYGMSFTTCKKCNCNY